MLSDELVKFRLLKIEYISSHDNDDCSADDERSAVFDWLDENYGRHSWKSKESGPIGNGKGIVIAEVVLV